MAEETQKKAAASKKGTQRTGSKKRTARSTSTKSQKKKDDATPQKLRIKVRAYENKVLDTSIQQIMDTAVRYEAEVVGPVPMPTAVRKYTVHRAPFIYEDAREQFEMRMHKRLIDIINPSPKVIDALTNLNLPSGVSVDVQMV